MGYSRWDDTAYTAYASTNNLQRATQAQIFTQSSIHPELDPKSIKLRESRDSEQNPNSTPLIFGLDVTGSMGYIAEAIVRDGLPKLFESMYSGNVLSDPHVMFMGLGDVTAGDRAPLQMSQFESDIRLVEQLRTIWLEKRGGGNDSESYTLAWWAALHKTDTDAAKAGRKGFLFTIGDEMVPPDLTRNELERVFGSSVPRETPPNNRALMEQVSANWHVFHIVAEDGSHCQYARRREEVRAGWTKLLGNGAIFMRDNKDLVKIVETILRVYKGESLEHLTAESEVLQYAFANALSTEQ